MKKLKKIKENLNLSFKGIMPNGKGFLLSFEEANEIIKKNPKNLECIKYYLNGHDLNHRPDQSASRMIIDFQNWPLEKAMEYKECFEIVKKKVKPQRLANTSSTNHAKRAIKLWWQYGEKQPKMQKHIQPLKKFIVISRVAKYFVFVMIENQNIVPSDSLMVIASDNFLILGVLNSKFHVLWSEFRAFRGYIPKYTNTTVFETFPFPSTDKDHFKVGEIMKQIQIYRQQACAKQHIGLTTLYTQMFDGGHELLRQLHKQLDHAVAYLYGFPIEFLDDDEKIIAFLTHLNHEKTKEN